MILPFSTQLNGKPTYFVEKIWETILQKGIQINMNDFLEFGQKALPKNYIVGTHKPKLHTIREDAKDRWERGTTIDFFINNTKPNMFRFAPRIPVVSVQKIEIEKLCDSGIWYQDFIVLVDDVYQNVNDIISIAQNDGFDNVQDFFAYFNEDFKGKLIHWTNLKY